jgi:protein TonB
MLAMMISQLDLPRRQDRPAGKPILTWLLPAAVTLVLHAGVFALLVANWHPAHPAHPAAPSEALLQTRVITLTMLAPPSSRANDLTVAPSLPATPPPVQPVQQPPAAAKPQIDHAAIARKIRQAEEQKQAQLQLQKEKALRQEQEAKKQQEITRRKHEEALQAEQQAALLAAHLQNQEAERARQAMAEAAMAAATAKAEAEATAAASRQYLPISKQAPAYPRRALDQRKEGDCTVEYTVTAEGTVSEPKLVEDACDDPVFARPSLTAASSFRYQPRMIEGKAVAVPGVRNTFRYRIE